MKNAIEIEELILEIGTGKQNLFSVLEEYEKKMDNFDEETRDDLELKIRFMEETISKCVDEIERLLAILDRDTRKLNKKYSDKITKEARKYIRE